MAVSSQAAVFVLWEQQSFVCVESDLSERDPEMSTDSVQIHRMTLSRLLHNTVTIIHPMLLFKMTSNLAGGI